MKQFIVIKCKDTIVAIKPFVSFHNFHLKIKISFLIKNRNINDDYFNQPRLKAIENAMKKMSLLR